MKQPACLIHCPELKGITIYSLSMDKWTGTFKAVASRGCGADIPAPSPVFTALAHEVQ